MSILDKLTSRSYKLVSTISVMIIVCTFVTIWIGIIVNPKIVANIIHTLLPITSIIVTGIFTANTNNNMESNVLPIVDNTICNKCGKKV